MSPWHHVPSFIPTPEQAVYGLPSLPFEDWPYWADIARRTTCRYCRSPLVELAQDDNQDRLDEDNFWGAPACVCPICGWWVMRCGYNTGLRSDSLCNFGVLKSLNLADLKTPVEQIRSYLLAQFDRRFDLHPRLMEETVAAVMSDFGFTCEVTAYSGDGGIDAVLQSTVGTTVGIQVKRYRDKIKVEQIRAFVGALVLGGMTKGIFVTTSEFQPAAVNAAKY